MVDSGRYTLVVCLEKMYRFVISPGKELGFDKGLFASFYRSWQPQRVPQLWIDSLDQKTM